MPLWPFQEWITDGSKIHGVLSLGTANWNAAKESSMAAMRKALTEYIGACVSNLIGSLSRRQRINKITETSALARGYRWL